MSYRVRYTESARDDLRRLYEFQLERDVEAAAGALEAIAKSMEILRDFPFACRKASEADPFLRELVIPFGAAGYVALFEIDDERTVTILAVRHLVEDDYH